MRTGSDFGFEIGSCSIFHKFGKTPKKIHCNVLATMIGLIQSTTMIGLLTSLLPSLPYLATTCAFPEAGFLILSNCDDDPDLAPGRKTVEPFSIQRFLFT